MVTGASTANLAIILIDARKGMLNKLIAMLYSFIIAIPHAIVCVNKMDLVDYEKKFMIKL